MKKIFLAMALAIMVLCGCNAAKEYTREVVPKIHVDTPYGEYDRETDPETGETRVMVDGLPIGVRCGE